MNFITAKDPVPVQCPIAGKFNFTQHGEHLFETRYRIILNAIINSSKLSWLSKQQMHRFFTTKYFYPIQF